MAYSAQQLVDQGYRKYIGWGDAEANADFNAVHPAKDSVGGAASVSDPVAEAQKINDFYKSQNAPIVTALQGQQGSLGQVYGDLVSSIKGLGSVQQNQQTLTTNNELGKRGILPTSGFYQQNMANSLLPGNQAVSAQLTNAEQGYNKDAADLAYQIASAQAGNPAGALSFASNLAGQQQQASQFAQQLALNQQAQNFNQRYVTVPYYGVYDVNSGQYVGNNNSSGYTMINGVPYVNK